MKKIFILLLALILCVGCTRIDNINNLDTVVDTIINDNNSKTNTISLGYKYYLPLGISKTNDKDYNQKLKFDNTFIYLYVDAVSYYYKNSLNFDEKDEKSYYYRKINNDDKTGYIKITKDNKYFIKVVYNYAKIETYANEDNLKSILSNSLIILDSIEYNDNLIKKILEDEKKTSVDREYKIKKPENIESKFSEYLSEYVQEEENIIPDLPEY